VPKLGSGTDDHTAGATVQALNDWNNPHHLITACCSDTTSSNIGVYAGA